MTRTSGGTVSAPTGAGRMGSWLGWGALSGFLAGVVFIVLNSWFASTVGKPALGPLKTIATLIEGPPPPQATVWIGVVVHVVLSVLFGLVFAAAVAPMRVGSGGSVAWAGLLFGGIIYVADFQILARFIQQFSAFQMTNQPFELTVHLLFGAVLAALLLIGPGRA